MSELLTDLTEADASTARDEVERVLSSRTFGQADRLRRFLQYIFDRSLTGATKDLNQYAIAIDVFDRDESFDPTIDAIVRVEAGRLRSKLLEFYDDEGANNLVRISLAKRGYKIQLKNLSDVAPAAQPVPAVPDTVTTVNPTIAVLPFDNMSADPEQEYFSDGITEDLITDLSRLQGLSVISRQSSFVYKGVATIAQEVSDKLGAEYIVEGSVRKLGRRIRINVQLIEGGSGKHLWAERFDSEIEDIFELQDSVNRKILDALRLQLSRVNYAESQRKRTEIVEAYDYLLRGMNEDQKRTREGAASARYCFRSALELDPEYSAPYARLSINAIFQWISGWDNVFEDTVDKGAEFAKKAIELDPQNGFAHTAYSWALLWQAEHDAAKKEGEKAIELDPNDVAALERLALVLAWSGETDDALQLLAKAQLLNPLSAYNFPTGLCYFMRKNYNTAVEFFRSSINANATFLPSYLYLAATLSLLGQENQAAPVVQKIKELSPSYHPDEIRFSIFKFEEDRKRLVNAITRVF